MHPTLKCNAGIYGKDRYVKENIDEIALSISAITTAVDEGAEGINGAAKARRIWLKIS